MLDFRKVLLAAAVAGLGLVSTASAQVACTAIGPGTGGGVAAGPPVVFGAPILTAATGVRNEGITEQITPLVVSGCTGTLNNAAFSLTVSLSVPDTNVQLTGQSGVAPYTDSVAVAQGFAGLTTTLLTTTGYSTPGSSSITYAFTGGSTTVAVPTNASITIYNIRANVSALAANAAVTATTSGSTSLIAPTTTATIAYAQASLASKAFNGFANLALCNVATGDVNALAIVSFKEAFVNVLTTDGEELTRETNVVTAGGFAYPAGAGSAPAGGTNPIAAGATAPTGTRLAVTFANLSTGVTYYIPAIVTTTLGTTLNLISGPTCAAACPVIAGGSVGTAGSNKGNVGTAAVGGVVGFQATSGTFTAYYDVTVDSQAAIDGNTFTSVFSTGTPAVLTPLPTAGPYPAIVLFAQTSATAVAASGAPTMSIYLVGGSTGYAQFLAPASPTVTTASASTFVPTPTSAVVLPVTGGNTQPGAAAGTTLVEGTGGLNACNTTMVFPYIINTGGYDTGIAITNAGLGSSVSGNTVTSTAGSCTMSLWGAASLNGTAVTPFTLTPVSIAAGQVTAFTLSGALAGTANASGFAGYAIANCNFQGGHGFAFITDGFGTSPGRGLSQGYLAPILSDVFAGGYATINNPF